MQRRQSVLSGASLSAASTNPDEVTAGKRRPQSVRFRSRDEVHVIERYESADLSKRTSAQLRPSFDVTATSEERIARPRTSSLTGVTMYRLGAILLLIAAIVPFLRDT